MTDFTVTVGDLDLEGTWTEENPETRAAIADALPLEGQATRWGDELYVRTPVDVGEEESQVEVPEGAVAYWPQGNAICLFWGPTPASEGDEPRAASPVNLVGVLADPGRLDAIDGDARVRIDS